VVPLIVWMFFYVLIGLMIFVGGLMRLDEIHWIGFRALPEVFVLQLLTFVLFWPVFLALEFGQR